MVNANILNTQANMPNDGKEYYSSLDKIYPYRDMGRWVANKNTGKLLRKLSRTNSNYTILGDDINLDDTTEMIVVVVPAFYRKKDCRVSGVEKQGIALGVKPDTYGTNCPAGYVIEGWFKEPDGTIAPYRILGAFPGYLDSDGQLTSVPYQIPTRSLNIQQFRDYAKVNRTASKAGIISFYAVSAIQRLFICEFGDFNSQKALGLGKTLLSTDDDVVASSYDIIKSGETMELGDRSGYLNRTYNEEELTDGKVSISYRGLEDFFGNIWQFVDGLITVDTGYYYTNNLTYMAQILSDNVLNVNNWDYMEATVPTSNGYAKYMQEGDLDFAFLTGKIGGSSSTYYSDYHYAYNGNGALRVALLGGRWNTGATAGAFSWSLYYSASAATSNLGSRLELRA